MNNLRRLLTQPLKAVPTSIVIVLLVVALLGFADSAFLTLKHFQGVIPPCTVVDGCETVLTSSYSSVLGIPVSLFGSVYYLLILIGLYAYIDTRNVKILKWTLLLTFLGFMMTLGLMYIMAFILKAFCSYCLVSAITSTILFISSTIILRKFKLEEIQVDAQLQN